VDCRKPHDKRVKLRGQLPQQGNHSVNAGKEALAVFHERRVQEAIQRPVEIKASRTSQNPQVVILKNNTSRCSISSRCDKRCTEHHQKLINQRHLLHVASGPTCFVTWLTPRLCLPSSGGLIAPVLSPAQPIPDQICLHTCHHCCWQQVLHCHIHWS
jgi:hypothetical protein